VIVYPLFFPRLLEEIRLDPFLPMVFYEMTSISEWIFFFLCLSLVLLYNGETLHIHPGNLGRKARRSLYLAPIIASMALGLYSAAILLFSVPNYLLSYGFNEDFLVIALLCFAGAAIIAMKPFDRDIRPTPTSHLREEEFAFWSTEK
jgi:hypothetical protein